ncbi:MAG: LamG domain-containing protein [Planctomycetota bacterium]
MKSKRNPLRTVLLFALAICVTSPNLKAALRFDGVDDYVALPGNDPVWLPEYDFTLSAWVYFEREPGSAHEVILDLNCGASSHLNNRLGYIVQLTLAYDGKLSFGMYTTSSTEVVSTDEALVKDTWYHIVAIRDGTTQAIYIDGHLDASTTCLADPVDFVGGYDDDKVNIGRYTTLPGQPRYHFQGMIEDVAIYERALSASEIWEVYEVGVFSDPGLTGHWPFDEMEGQTAHDLSGNGRHGYLGGDPCEPDDSDPTWIQTAMPAAVDIKPGSCPNPLNPASRGVLPVAVLGSEDFDVNTIDTASIRLAGVAPVRSHYEDVATPVADANVCECNVDGPDGFMDLTLKFKTQAIVEQIVNAFDDLVKDDEFVLTLKGTLSDGTRIEGTDCVRIIGKVPRTLAAKKADVNQDGIVDIFDFSSMAEFWLEPTILDY